MASQVSSGSSVAWREAERLPTSGFLRPAMALVLGMGAAIAAGLVLPATAFRARAVIAVADTSSPNSVLLSRAAADAAVSEPVMRRAAESLIGTNIVIPAPGLIERVAVAVGGTRPTGQAARLAAHLLDVVSAKPGELPGSLEISATSPNRDHAPELATAVAEALIANHDDLVAQARRKRDFESLARVERLQTEAASARRRLAALGGVEADPAQMRAAAAVQTSNAQARLDIIQAIMASGTPPLSDRRDVPSGIEALQTDYLDLSRQLAKARETLGDRHTTIISLQAEVKHAAASLTAEWRRLDHLAEAEVTAARQRDAALRMPETAAAASRRDAIEAARSAVEVANEAVARAQAAQHETPADERTYRLIARAAVPVAPIGVSPTFRALAAGLAGALVFVIGSRRPGLRNARSFASRGRQPQQTVNRADPPVSPADAAAVHAARPDVPLLATASDDLKRGTMRNPRETGFERGKDPMGSLTHRLLDLGRIVPAFGGVPTIMVAADEDDTGTMPVALALGRAALEDGYRVLVVETPRARPGLAAAADAEADPVLIDLYGELRVALRAEAVGGALYLVPSLEQGARLASALARDGDTLLLDDIATEFDLVVIDGGCARASAAAGWGADAFIRVGAPASQREDDRFAATFGVTSSALLGTIAASTATSTAMPTATSTARQTPLFGKHPRLAAASQPLGNAPRQGTAFARVAMTRRRVGIR